MNIIRNLPTPIAGLALGSVALGNLLQAYSPTLQLIFSILSLIIIVLLTIKFITNFDKLKEEMAGLLRENDSLSKELTAVIEDRNKYRSQLLDQEYYLTDKERDEIAEKIIQRKDLELEDGEKTFERDDLDLSR